MNYIGKRKTLRLRKENYVIHRWSFSLTSDVAEKLPLFTYHFNTTYVLVEKDVEFCGFQACLHLCV